MVVRSRMERIQFVLKYRFETRSRKDRCAAKNTVKICLPKLETKDMLVRPKMEVRRSLRRRAGPQKRRRNLKVRRSLWRAVQHLQFLQALQNSASYLRMCLKRKSEKTKIALPNLLFILRSSFSCFLAFLLSCFLAFLLSCFLAFFFS